MEYISQTMKFHIDKPTVVTIGKFDGRHRGHDLLLEALLDKRKNGLASVVFTFDIPPQKNIAGHMPKVLTTNEEKRYILEEAGVDYLIECPFTDEVMQMEPVDFLEWIAACLHVQCIIAGSDFCFGYQRTGDCRLIQAHAQRLGYELEVIHKVKEDDKDISSTRIREEIQSGNLKKANHLLGYEYFVTSRVVHGNSIGRTLGFPTINMVLPEEKLLPPNGVYVTRVSIKEQWYMGVTNIGRKPTIAVGNPIGVETYIIDFCQDLYEQIVTVSFLEYIRPERKFASVEELKQQMNSDIAYAQLNYVFTN